MRTIPTAARIAATVLAYALLGPADAHHAFITEFDPETSGEVVGVVTKVWWQNPHIRYDVDVTKEDGTVEQWSLHPPGNLPTYRRQGWTPETLKAGDRVRATGNLGRDGARKLYSTCIYLPNGRELGRCVVSDTVTETTADPNVDYTYKHNDYEVDISGFWDNRYRFRVTVDDFEPKPMPMKPETAAIYAARKYGDDAVLQCMPPGLPRIFGSPYPMEIVDAGTHYLMVFLQDNTPRWVWMDGRSAPPGHPLTSMGFSVGRWEGRTLVIETTNLSPAWLDGSGLPMSGDGTRIVERWEVSEDGLTMDRTMTIHDPYYTEPLVRRRASARGDDIRIAEQLPCDPDSHYRDLANSGRLEEHFNR